MTAKKSMHRGSRKVVTDKDLEQFLPTAVQKSCFMLSDVERTVLNTALEKYQLWRSEPILVGRQESAETGVTVDDLLSLEDRAGPQWPGGYELHTLGRCRAGDGR